MVVPYTDPPFGKPLQEVQWGDHSISKIYLASYWRILLLSSFWDREDIEGYERPLYPYLSYVHHLDFGTLIALVSELYEPFSQPSPRILYRKKLMGIGTPDEGFMVKNFERGIDNYEELALYVKNLGENPYFNVLTDMICGR